MGEENVFPNEYDPQNFDEILRFSICLD